MIQLQARKSLGQNFLIDKKVHQRIVEHLAAKPEDTVIEIGPGTGLLTQVLLRSPLRKLIAFELDERAVPELKREFESEGERFEVIEKDFLTVVLAELQKSAAPGAKIRVAGNIPYNITSPILFKLLEAREFVHDAHLLVQLEVAERLTASPRTKEYGIPTVLANFFGTVSYMFKVPAGSFRPVPRVDSGVVYLDLSRDYFARENAERPEGFQEREFQSFVRGMFRMRRKTIRNNLKGLVEAEAVERLATTERGARYLTQRPEELSVREFLELYQLTRPEGPAATDPNPTI